MTDPYRPTTTLPGTRTDMHQPSRDLGKIPMISAEAYQHMGRFSGALVVSAFEMIGGLPRMAQWADENPTDFFTKLFPKLITKAQQVDVSGTLTIDDAISRLESQGRVIDNDPAPRERPVVDYGDDEMPARAFDL